MPPPKISDFEFYPEVPTKLKNDRVDGEEKWDILYRYLKMIHTRLFSARDVDGELKGDLDGDNIASFDPTDNLASVPDKPAARNNLGITHSNLPDVSRFQHHGSDNHHLLTQCDDVTPVAVTATGAAGATYTAAEQAIINALIADVANLQNKINELIDELEEARLMA